MGSEKTQEKDAPEVFAGLVAGGLVSVLLFWSVRVLHFAGGFGSLAVIVMGMISMSIGMFGDTLLQSLVTRNATIIASVTTPLLSLLRFHKVICSGCLRYTTPVKSLYEHGVRYCEHCQQEVLHSNVCHTLAFTFGTIDLPTEAGRVTLSNPGFQLMNHAVDVSEVYLDTHTCHPHKLERFITYIINYPPTHGVKAIRIFYKGRLEELGNNLNNTFHNTFNHIKQLS